MKHIFMAKLLLEYDDDDHEDFCKVNPNLICKQALDVHNKKLCKSWYRFHEQQYSNFLI
jgi:hypothetical protein